MKKEERSLIMGEDSILPRVSGMGKGLKAIREGDRTVDTIYEAIAKKYDEMSKSQQKIATYILQNRAGVSFMNVSSLAKAASVSEATIIRFAAFMGYKGYPQMQKELQEQTRLQLSMKERINISKDAYSDRQTGLLQIFNDETDRLKATLEGLDLESFFAAVEEIRRAKRVFVIAGRSAAALGHFMQYYLNMMLGNVFLIGDGDGSEELLCDLGSQDLVIGLTFSRYTRRTCELIHFARSCGAVTVSITDRMTSPVIKDSVYYLLAETAMPTYLDSFVAPLTLINGILIYLGQAKDPDTEGRISKLEEMWSKFGTFQ